MKFLRPSKFHIEEAYQRIKRYYKFRKDYKRNINTTMQVMKLAFDSEIFQNMPQLDRKGRRIFIFNVESIIGS